MQKKIHGDLSIKICNKDRFHVTVFSFAFGFNVAWLCTDPDNTILRTEMFLLPHLFLIEAE